MVSKSRTEYSVAFLFSPHNDWIYQFFDPLSLRKSWDGEIFVSFEPNEIVGYDIVFILGYTRILDDNFLKENALNLVIHESALPAGKGFAPLQWQILEGRNEFTVTLFEATSAPDSGDIILQTQLRLNGTELYDEIRNKQAKCTFDLIARFLSTFPDFSRTEQVGEESYYPRRRKADGELSVEKTIAEQFDLLRIGNNNGWPSFFIFRGERYIIEIKKETAVKAHEMARVKKK